MSKRRYPIALWILIYALSLIVTTVARAETNTVPGWIVKKGTHLGPGADTCMSTWTKEGPAELSIAAEGPLLLLTVSSPTFGDKKREEVVSLRTGLGQLERRALVADSTYGITVDSDVDAYLLYEGPLVVTIKGKDYSFRLANASAAMDAARQCAGQPTRAELQAKKAPPVPIPEGWELGELGNGCVARLNGNGIDTMLSINDDKVLLIGGRRDWSSWGGDIKLTLQFDSEAPVRLLLGDGTTWFSYFWWMTRT